MKKTLTITFHSPTNNGSFLQAYALQRTLIDKCGVENRIIDFQSDKQKKLYALFRPVKSKMDVAKNLVSLLHFRKLKSRKEMFKKMQREHLLLTEEISSEEEVYKIANSADINIVGSDQIWNTKALDFSPAYFLQGVTTPKITYAVSCGSNSNIEMLNDYKDDINDFDRISLRENSIKSILDFYKGDICVSCDPTMLLEDADYFPLFEKERIVEKEYILLYSMSYSEEILKTAQKISNELNIPVITPFNTYSTVKCKKYGIKIKYDAAPNDFLNLVYNAKFILTNSFHGTAFSLIFKKDFYHVCDVLNDGTYKRDNRIDDLLDYLELERNISFKTDVASIKDNISVKYECIDEKIKELKKSSIKYLNKTLRNNE